MNEKRKIRVLVVDDSLFMRQMISDVLRSDSNIEVVDTAINGEEGITKIKNLQPDVVTLDYEMPGSNGIATLRKIMHECPIPVVMISAFTREGGEITLKALAYGAVDYILKPSGTISLNIKSIADEIIGKVKMAARANIEALLKSLNFQPSGFQEEDLKHRVLASNACVAIGSSTGGTKGIELILESLPAAFPAPIVIVQHMPEMFTALFADRLNRLTKITVKEGQDKEEIKKGVAYIAPGGWHMEVEVQNEKFKIHNSKKPPIYSLRPAVDVLFKSVARAYGNSTIGIILSGMGADGTDGLVAIAQAGGKTIAQDENTSVVFGMPLRAIEAGVVDDVLPIGKIAPRIMELIF
jgi:two-component system, chemotaxis family, protein-glutamate methylesterase/glutaminase